jgi:centrosomal protein CEP164
MSGPGSVNDGTNPSVGNVDSIILEEEIDPSYVPSEAEVVEYAKWLGMDLNTDQDLFWVAREGLMAPLPKNWKPCKTKDTEDIYYFNFATGESTWDHPCDGYYKRLYEEEKKKKEMCMKESKDQVRSKAKQDVEVLLGKNEKKKKKKATTVTLEAPGLKAASSVSRLVAPLERKPLPDILSKPSLSSEPSIPFILYETQRGHSNLQNIILEQLLRLK